VKYAKHAEEKNNAAAIRTIVAGLGMLLSVSDDAAEYLLKKLEIDNPEIRQMAYNCLIYVIKFYYEFDYQASLPIRSRLKQ